MHPYTNEGFFSFILTLWERLFLFCTLQLKPSELVSEDLQFLALILSGTLGLLLGFYLVYNKLTMLANSLSHTILLGLILTFLMARHFIGALFIDNVPFYLQMIASVLTALLTLLSISYLSKRLSMEASNAFSFTMFFALGILLSSSLLKNTHLGLESVLGNLEALSFVDISRLFTALMIVGSFLVLMQTRLKLVSFDSLFAKTIGINPMRYKQAIVLISSLSLMVCFRTLGVILILSLLTAPIMIARRFYQSQKKILIFGMMFVIFQTTFCLALSQKLYVDHALAVSTSGLFGSLGLIFYFIFSRMKKATA